MKEFDTFCPPTPPKPSPVETPKFTGEEPLKYQLTLADALNKQLMKEVSRHPSKAKSRVSPTLPECYRLYLSNCKDHKQRVFKLYDEDDIKFTDAVLDNLIHSVSPLKVGNR